MITKTEVLPNMPDNGLQKAIELIKSDFGVFEERHPYFSCSRLYYAYFEEIPSLKVIHRDFDYKRAITWLKAEMSESILKQHKREECSFYKRELLRTEEDIFILSGRLLIGLGSNYALILFTENQEHQAEALLKRMQEFKIKKTRTTQISIVTEGRDGHNLIDIENKKPRLQLQKNYNDDLLSFHQKITRELKSTKRSGLLLLHGVPGSGKSTYIRYLIHCVSKRVIFLSPRVAGNLDSPELITLLIQNPNSILVIEEAENLIASRDSNDNHGIATLLNLSDGILGENLGMQVICTFNTHINNIDKALLRKGRLIGSYEFKPLSAAKSKALLEELGIQGFLPHKPMTLAEIYHAQSNHFEFKMEKRNTIGFMAPAASAS